jgi:hypothetical protein
MENKDEHEGYRSFLLRMWRNRDVDWRFSVEDTVSGNRLGFSSLGMLFDYFLKLVRSEDRSEQDGPEYE